jgi:hypothetical protein
LDEDLGSIQSGNRTYDAGRGVGSLRVQGAQIVAFVSSSIDDEIIVLDE